MIRLFRDGRQKESVPVDIDYFCAYVPLEGKGDDTHDHKYVVNGDSKHVEDEVHVNTYESDMSPNKH